MKFDKMERGKLKCMKVVEWLKQKSRWFGHGENARPGAEHTKSIYKSELDRMDLIERSIVS